MPRKIVVFSFCPGSRFDPEFKLHGANDQKWLKQRGINEIGGSASRCAWIVDDDGSVSPVFVYDEPNRIFESIIEWSEERPDQWFDLYLLEDAGHYGLVLFPRLTKSIARFNVGMISTYEEIVNINDVDMVYEPLTFFSETNDNAFSRYNLGSRIKSKTPVCFHGQGNLRHHNDCLAVYNIELIRYELGKDYSVPVGVPITDPRHNAAFAAEFIEKWWANRFKQDSD